MQYSVALLLGLAGSCRVAAFGTMPDLSGFKDAKISTRGEGANDGETVPLKLDPHFCTNAISKNYLGADYCNAADDLGAAYCGGGSDTYRRGTNDPNKYDACQWRCETDGSCGCKLAGYTYQCGTQCFPTAASMTETTNDNECGADEHYVECGPYLKDCVSNQFTAVCDEALVTVQDASGQWVVQEKYEIKRIDSTRRRLHGRELADNCGTDEDPLCAGPDNPIETTYINEKTQQQTIEKCSCVANEGCSCKLVTSLVFTKDAEDQDTAQSVSDICEDVEPEVDWWRLQ
jgi:hypothetical protein